MTTNIKKKYNITNLHSYIYYKKHNIRANIYCDYCKIKQKSKKNIFIHVSPNNVLCQDCQLEMITIVDNKDNKDPNYKPMKFDKLIFCVICKESIENTSNIHLMNIFNGIFICNKCSDKTVTCCDCSIKLLPDQIAFCDTHSQTYECACASCVCKLYDTTDPYDGDNNSDTLSGTSEIIFPEYYTSASGNIHYRPRYGKKV